MDFNTHLAIQAVVRGLFQGGVIGEERVQVIVRELLTAAESQREQGHSADELKRLANDIARIGN